MTPVHEPLRTSTLGEMPRRDFLKLTGLAALGASIPGCRRGEKPVPPMTTSLQSGWSRSNWRVSSITRWVSTTR